MGGSQGMGVDTSANVFGAAIARSGYYIFGSREYFSNIKGRHSYFSIVISDKVQHSIDETVDILAAFDAETVAQHFDDVTGHMIYDKAHEGINIAGIRSMEGEMRARQVKLLEDAGYGPTIGDIVKYLKAKGVNVIPVDYGALMKGIINQLKMDPFVAERARNMLCIGASFALLGFPESSLEDAVRSNFANKKVLIDLNVLAVSAGYKAAENAYSLNQLKGNERRVQLDGNTLSALGKMYGGLRFQSYYPITPASDESTYIEANQLMDTKDGKARQGIVVVQVEDELAAINAASGAALAGSRSATATSGPGFSLMNEGISWAGMNEVPVLITYYMRGSPATGLPTRSGQSDIKLALNAGHGEFARIVLASGDHGEIFEDAVMALNLAELCQTPTVHVIEKTLANAYSILDESTVKPKSLSVDRGKIVFPEDPDHYKRFEFTDDGISPRAFLGHAQMYYTGDEHNEYGHITEDSINRTRMYEKRIIKLAAASKYVPDNRKVNIVGNSDTVLLTWGSPKGAIMDSMDELASQGIKVEMVQVRLFSPYPTELISRALQGKKRIIAVENDYNALGAEVLAERTGIRPTNLILKWNGRPIMRSEIISAVQEIIKKGTQKVVLNGGK